LPDTALLRKEFGCSGNQNRMVARAKASCLFDVLNKVINACNLLHISLMTLTGYHPHFVEYQLMGQ
jgi:hypothetical protein